MALLAALCFVGIMGCSQLPTANDEPVIADNPILLTRAASAAKILGDSAYVETIISAQLGGVVSLIDVELSFPPGSLNNDTLISIAIPDLFVFENHFGTDGLVFNMPVKVVMSYRDADLTGIDETSIKMAWYNDSFDHWDIIDCEINFENKTVTAFVNHFSAYGLISD
ncbi:MAG: hypothetical protein CVT49_04310 [candidate division Zixibacteria bacterium HGW-Zixibacteria-1]|nr:MAG: hypothetical protein CVT49_04310 [candidate division Zixibacteria bacterium HGW-Zixibacteria-1]